MALGRESRYDEMLLWLVRKVREVSDVSAVCDVMASAPEVTVDSLALLRG